MTGRRFAPLGVRPFGRLLASYTVNEIGDAVGVVALAVLVYQSIVLSEFGNNLQPTCPTHHSWVGCQRRDDSSC